MPKVLVIEEQPSVVALMRYHLEDAGIGAHFAANLDEGWRELNEHGPDAAVVDLRLTGANGWRFVERLRQEAQFKELPVMVLADEVDEETNRQAEELGCQVLAKPFAASALMTKIDLLLHQEARATTEPSTNGRKRKVLPVEVLLLLDRYQIEGTVYLPPEATRFSDAWEHLINDERAFFPVTDAKITRQQDGHMVAAAVFMQVRKAEVRGAFPLDLPVE
ncbi:MAG TPA: response regulator [Actinomycetota bacterium]|nr:response regulator [Actinomycetota bacterium]